MTTFCERFRSYYLTTYENLYFAWEPEHMVLADPSNRMIDVEESAARNPVPEGVRLMLDRVITPEIHARMASGDFNPEFYQARGFTVYKAGGTLVLEHRDLPDYLIKTARASRSFSSGTIPARMEKVEIAYTNLLRAEGRAYFAERADDPLFSFPEEYLYESPCVDPADPMAALHTRFFAISQKVDVYSSKESIDLVKNLDCNKQLELAKRVCALIKRTGLTDMHRGNLLLVRDLHDWTFSVIDTEPLGLYIEKDDDPRSLASKKERVLSGLINFRDLYCRANGLTEMAHYVDREIEDFVRMHPEKLQGKKVNNGRLIAGTWRDKEKKFDGLSVFLIILTIPFFYIVLPILALRAAFSAPRQEQLA